MGKLGGKLRLELPVRVMLSRFISPQSFYYCYYSVVCIYIFFLIISVKYGGNDGSIPVACRLLLSQFIYFVGGYITEIIYLKKLVL